MRYYKKNEHNIVGDVSYPKPKDVENWLQDSTDKVVSGMVDNGDGTFFINPPAILIPIVVTMRQARLALFQSDLLATMTDAIANSANEELKIEWEYATEVRRDWASLVTLTTSLGMTSTQLDDLFILANEL